MKKIRESNFELMRIISMLMIILWHVLMHGKIIDNVSGNLSILLNFIMFLISIHVNSFVMVTGYFQYDKKFKLSKVLSINTTMWFYKVLFMILFISLGTITLNKFEILKIALPFNMGDYWFIGIYILLYLTTPLLNIIINKFNQKEFKRLLIIMFLLVNVLGTITAGEFYYNGNGYILTNFIFLYFLGAYISKYNINLFKKKQSNIIISIVLLVLIAIIRTFLFVKLGNLPDSTPIILHIKKIIWDTRYGYATPLGIIQTLLYFNIFKNISFKNKIINLLASITMGIYLIHDNNFVREYIYLNIFNLPLETQYNSNILLSIIKIVFIIYITCTIIELIRKLVIKLISKTKMYKKINRNISNYIEKKGIVW